jgi:osmotically inducible protein OsmC
MKILYTTEAVVEGGRAGRGRTSDGRLVVELSVPKEFGGQGGSGTNPEQIQSRLGAAATAANLCLRSPSGSWSIRSR